MFILNSKFRWGGWWNNKNGRDHEGEAMFYFLVREKPVAKKKMLKWVCKTVECWQVWYKNSVCFEDLLHTECKGSAILEVKEELHSARF